MRPRLVRWLIPAGLAAAILLLLGLWPSGHVTPKVFAMSDVPDLLRQARTIHIHAFKYLPDSAATQPVKTEEEFWLDLQNNRWRHIEPSGGRDSKGSWRVKLCDEAYDGKYGMSLSDTEAGKVCRIFMPSQVFRAVQVRQRHDFIFTQILGAPGSLAGYSKVGQELIDGKPYDIWERFVATLPGKPDNVKVRAWLSPSTGELRQIRAWLNGWWTLGQWALLYDADRIELNVPIANNVFRTDPPAGYRLFNSKESLKPRRVHVCSPAFGQKAWLDIHSATTLDDGQAVIIGWSSGEGDHKTIPSQAHLFEGLKPGDPLPELPIVLERLSSMTEDVNYVGRHLAYTREGEQFYEWAIYVPEKNPPRRSSVYGYYWHLRFNTKDADKSRNGDGDTLQEDVSIQPCEFDFFVRGAMAEFSDNGVVPDYMTYDFTMNLAGQIRDSQHMQAAE